MKIKKATHITPVGGNVFLDLGFEPKEAARLQAESKRIIVAELAIKERLMKDITSWIQKNHLVQSDAAQRLGVTRPRVSDVVCMKSSKFTIDALVNMLTRAGKHVRLAVR